MLSTTHVGFLGLVFLAAVASPAYAAGSSDGCVDISVPKQAVAAHNGRWIELTSDQWQFMRGIYAMHPSTPLGLPFGDKAALVQFTDEPGGLVFFIDGDRACTPMAVPAALLTVIQDVATATIMHEAPGL
jgi:hypothetical protein